METPKRVLVVDDDPDSCALIADILEEDGHWVHPCLSGERALELLNKDHYDLVLSDIRMPRVSGMDLLLHVRRKRLATEVILVTAYASLDTAIQALRGEAFDYLTKPFSLADLRNSVRHALETGGKAGPHTVMRCGDLSIDVKSRRVWVGDRQVELTRLEFDLLAYLFSRQGETVRFEELLSRVWDEKPPTIDTLRSCVRRLRLKLGDDARQPMYIKNVWGVGYQLGD